MTARPLDPAPARPRASSLSCPSCGAAIESRAQGWAVTIVCSSCGAILDATDENLRVLQRQMDAIRVKPRLPLGTRGTWRGGEWELIGFQVVTITVDDTDYSWTEYVAFNPYRGFFYLSEYEGHWNVIEKLHVRPREERSGGRPVAIHDGRLYKHFQTATARTTVALGEFPWEVRVGDSVVSRDFTSPPYVLSAEASDSEMTWSLGTYTPPEVIGKAFGHADALIDPIGVYVNQPNPRAGAASSVARRLVLFVVALLLMLLGNIALSRGEIAFTNSYQFVHGTEDSAAFVTPAFELAGRPSSVTIDVDADLVNDWIYFDFTLINEATGMAHQLSKQVSYYSGTDSDGRWSEGSRKGSARIGSVPGGRYFLRVAPEGGEPAKSAVGYTLRVRRDVPSFLFYVLGFFALLVPAIFVWISSAAFETRRWSESDYASTSDDSSDDGDDDE